MNAGARTAVFKPVSPPSTYEETVARLGTAIRIGVLGPATRLPPERELADQLGISRSTLRQALATLTQTGHLVAVRGRAGGTFVSDAPPIRSGEHVPIESWRALMGWRLVVEIGAVHLAAARAGKDDLTRLADAHRAAAAAVDADWVVYRRADVAFHLALAEASGNARLVDAMTEVQGEVTELLGHISHPPLALRHAADQHGRILDCLREGDAARASAAMREHLDGTEQIVEGLLP